MTIKKSDQKLEGGSKNVKMDRVAKSPKSTSRCTKKLFTTDKASGSTSKSKVSSSKKLKVQKENEVGSLVFKEKTANKKQSNKSSTKDRGKGKAKSEPSKEEIQEAMPDLLAEFDLKVANYYDLYRKLGEHFGVDLTHRKKEIKEIFAQVMEEMADEEEENETTDNDT